MNRQNELLLRIVERYLFHKNYIADNPEIAKMEEKICDIEVTEMWMLTQTN